MPLEHRSRMASRSQLPEHAASIVGWISAKIGKAK